MKILLLIPNVSPEVGFLIIDNYPTCGALMGAYDKCENIKQQQLLLTHLQSKEIGAQYINLDHWFQYGTKKYEMDEELFQLKNMLQSPTETRIIDEQLSKRIWQSFHTPQQ